jgi:UDP-hydrolysing UDP-N-acetyl-D-glucosamine 2-epimerase
MKKKVCVVIASRANYGRAKILLKKIKNSKKLELQTVLAASSLLEKYGDLRSILKKDKIKVNAEAFIVLEGENTLTMTKSTGMAIIELSSIFNNLQPDMVITIGDRYETIATAIAASYMNKVLIHIQGGEITGSIDESVRHAITKLSHIHFASTKKSKRNIIRLGENKKNVYFSGCPSIDILRENNKDELKKFIKKTGVGGNIDLKKPYYLVVLHPITTEQNKSYKQTQILINSIIRLNAQIIWLWPNVDAGSDGISKCLRINREKGLLNKFRFFKNFPVEIYNELLKTAKCLIGNSSSFIRESSYLGSASVLVGDRQFKRERAKNVSSVGFNANKIYDLIKKQEGRQFKRSLMYGDGRASVRIVKVLENLKEINIQKTLNY